MHERPVSYCASFHLQLHLVTTTTMSSNRIEPGIYRIKVNGPPIGGSYATNNGVDNIVTAVAEVPPFIQRQNWEVKVGPSGNNFVIQPQSPPDVDSGWAYGDNDTLIRLLEPKEFDIVAVPGHSDVYTIEAVKLEIDTVLCVDVQADGDLILKVFVVPRPVELPKWQFQRQ